MWLVSSPHGILRRISQEYPPRTSSHSRLVDAYPKAVLDQNNGEALSIGIVTAAAALEPAHSEHMIHQSHQRRTMSSWGLA
jgi:hypothetical protein